MRREGRLRHEGLLMPSLLLKQYPFNPRHFRDPTHPRARPGSSERQLRAILTPACASSPPAACSSGSCSIFQSSDSLSSLAGLTSGGQRTKAMRKGGRRREQRRRQTPLCCHWVRDHPQLPARDSKMGEWWLFHGMAKSTPYLPSLGLLQQTWPHSQLGGLCLEPPL